MELTVFGAGYVGLVTGVVLAELGHRVTCVDPDARKIALLNDAKSPIHEPGLEPLIKKNLVSGKVRFTTSAEDAVKSAKVYMIAVGTPPDAYGRADLTAVHQVVSSIAENGPKDATVIIKSTVPVGTRRILLSSLQKAFQKRGIEFCGEVISNPEFLKEGEAVSECLKPSRILVGTDSDAAENLMRTLYHVQINRGVELQVMRPESCELAKYACNLMLASRVSFMNEMSRFADRAGANIEEVREAMGADPRIGPLFLRAGIGYGGSCFPKDIDSMRVQASEVGIDLPLVTAIRTVNDSQSDFAVKVIKEMWPEPQTLAVWGLSFKPGTDDTRESPALKIVSALLEDGYRLRVHDPVALERSRSALANGTIEYVPDLYECLRGADGLMLLTEWPDYVSASFARVRELLKSPMIFDGRNALDLRLLREFGFRVRGIGRSYAVLSGKGEPCP